MTDPNQISLREANIDDLDILKHWDEEPHVIDSDPSDGWNWETELKHFPEWRKMFIAELDGRPIGMIQIIDPLLEETHYWGECEPNLMAIDIWIGEANDLGKGYGTVMMSKALDFCFANPNVKAVIIDPLESNTDAIRFYKRIGFKFVEKRIFNEDKCEVLRIERNDWIKRN